MVREMNAEGYIAIFSQHVARFQTHSNALLVDLEILVRVSQKCRAIQGLPRSIAQGLRQD